MKEVILGLRNWGVMKGRSTRREYWIFWLFIMLFNFTFALVAGFITGVLNLSISENNLVIFVKIVYLIASIPLLYAGVRRLHDAGKSGWFLIVPLYNIVLLAQASQKGHNKYSPYPHSVAE